jgi:tRNA G18 (ribose-2'-O)-methylase SpoU
MTFTENKFKSLKPQHQHKTLAEILRGVYERLLNKEAIDQDLEDYNQLQEWLGKASLVNDIKSIADRYHWHLKHGCVSLKEHNFLPRVEKGDKEQGKPPLTTSIYLDNLRSAHNVGSILRCVEALSLGSVYFSPSTPYVDTKKVHDTSMGSHDWVWTFQDVPLENLPRPIIALETCPDAFDLDDFIFPEVFTLVVGNEEYGCSKETLQLADVIVKVPLYGRKNSLNVANAFAITAATIRRQNKQKSETSQ